MSTVLETLGRMEVFSGFSSVQRKALAKLMRLSRVEDGHVFITQGQPGEACYLVVDGSVAVTRTQELTGATQELKVLGPGELFGILSLLGRIPAAATCGARGPVQVAALPRADYQILFKVDAPIAYQFQWLVAQQIARDLLARNQALRASLEEG